MRPATSKQIQQLSLLISEAIDLPPENQENPEIERIKPIRPTMAANKPIRDLGSRPKTKNVGGERPQKQTALSPRQHAYVQAIKKYIPLKFSTTTTSSGQEQYNALPMSVDGGPEYYVFCSTHLFDRTASNSKEYKPERDYFGDFGVRPEKHTDALPDLYEKSNIGKFGQSVTNILHHLKALQDKKAGKTKTEQFNRLVDLKRKQIFTLLAKKGIVGPQAEKRVQHLTLNWQRDYDTLLQADMQSYDTIFNSNDSWIATFVKPTISQSTKDSLYFDPAQLRSSYVSPVPMRDFVETTNIACMLGPKEKHKDLWDNICLAFNVPKNTTALFLVTIYPVSNKYTISVDPNDPDLVSDTAEALVQTDGNKLGNLHRGHTIRGQGAARIHILEDKKPLPRQRR